MYRALFQNSKVALGFAALTILGAVSMVGTSEDSGLLLRAASLVGGYRSNNAANAGAVPPSEAPPPSVFGEYQPGDGSAAAPASGGASGTGTGQVGNPMTAPVAPSAIVVDGGTFSSDGYVPQSELEVPAE